MALSVVSMSRLGMGMNVRLRRLAGRALRTLLVEQEAAAFTPDGPLLAEPSRFRLQENLHFGPALRQRPEIEGWTAGDLAAAGDPARRAGRQVPATRIDRHRRDEIAQHVALAIGDDADFGVTRTASLHLKSRHAGCDAAGGENAQVQDFLAPQHLWREPHMRRPSTRRNAAPDLLLLIVPLHQVPQLAAAGVVVIALTFAVPPHDHLVAVLLDLLDHDARRARDPFLVQLAFVLPHEQPAAFLRVRQGAANVFRPAMMTDVVAIAA